MVDRAREVLASARFAVPDPSGGHVSRRRLLSRLDAGKGVPLVLVSAPAGAGKTALVAEWARRLGGRAMGWVTFETGDEAVWPLLLQALARLSVDVPPGTVPATRPSRRLLTALSANLARLPSAVTVVLDGIELTSATDGEDLDFLLRHSGRKLRLVVTTRVDPVLPLYRYRLEDLLVELRAADLAFTDTEARDLFAGAGVVLTSANVHRLNLRVGGWAAGLRFVARSMSGRSDPDAAVDDVVSETVDIGEYLLTEVLDTQTPEVRQFLLDTSVADTLHPELVEQLVGHAAARTLSRLNGLNTFVEPVGGAGGCFRYHPIFRDLLRAQLSYENPDRLADLHVRTARWFRGEGDVDSAVGHLNATDAWQEAAELVVDSLAVGRLLAADDEHPMVAAMSGIPADTPGAEASVIRAVLALRAAEPDLCADELRAVRSYPDEPGVAVCAAVVDAERARVADPPPDACEAAERARALLRHLHQPATPKDRSLLGALTARCLGVARLRAGHLDAAAVALEAGARFAEESGDHALAADCLGRLALAEAVEGQLSEANRHAGESAAASDGAGRPTSWRSPAGLVALAWVAYERYDLRRAHEATRTALEAASLADDPVARGLLELVKAGLQRARGHFSLALTTLEHAAAQTPREETWLQARIAAERAKLQVSGGTPEPVPAETSTLPSERVPEAALALAQERLARRDYAAVADVLSPALADSSPLPTRVSALLVEAAVEAAEHSPGRARDPLERAVRLAAPEQLRRPLREAPDRTRQLLAGGLLPATETRWLDSTLQQPVERLTARELEVLTHLDELLTTDEIADVMFVSVNTVRTHVRSILRKLDAPRRNAAVRRARELGLLDG
jgi:LuxR family maltose regulon positive regulatory protein